MSRRPCPDFDDEDGPIPDRNDRNASSVSTALENGKLVTTVDDLFAG